jgi:uncharacterized protein YdaU (DUF1376 family)
LELWVNHRLPCNPAALAKVLGFDTGEVAAALPAAMTFFKIDGDSIFSPQLEDYRAHLNEIREKQKTGGRKGAEIANKRRRRSKTRPDIKLERITADPQVHPRVHPQVEALVSSTSKSSKAKSNPPLEKGLVPADPWLNDYTAAQTPTRTVKIKI